MQWKNQDLRLLLLKIIVKIKGFMTASVMARLLLALGYFIYDGHKRGGSMMSLLMGHMMAEKGRNSFLMFNVVPQEYAELSNSLPSSPEIFQQEKIFTASTVVLVMVNPD